MKHRVTRDDIAFDAEGITLRGWLFRPHNQNKPAPAIVLTHGWNCLKEFYLDKYAEVFCQAGFVVLAYDNRNFGDSDGLPRQEIDPWQQVRDYRHAISFLQTHSFVDQNRIGIWGTSYSGGHVMVVAALDKRVKAVVSQVPTISGWEGMLRRILPGQWAQQRALFEQDRLQRYQGQPPMMINTVSDPNEPNDASHQSTDAWYFFTGKDAPDADAWRFKNWRKDITLRSFEMYSEYEPGSYLSRVSPTPFLMQVAENDVVAVTDEALRAFNNDAREIKKLTLFKGGHFSAYIEQFDLLSSEACQWFQQYL